jgi:hypothetical protein
MLAALAHRASAKKTKKERQSGCSLFFACIRTAFRLTLRGAYAERAAATALPFRSPSEWHLVRPFRLRRGSALRSISEQTHLQSDDFGSIARAAPVLRFVLASCQPSLDVYLPSLGKQALAVVRELPEHNNSMPLIWNDHFNASLFL